MRSTRSLVSMVAGFCALAFVLMALIYWAVLAPQPFSISSIDWPLGILVIATVVAFGTYLITSPESIGQTVGKRSTRLGANALIVSIVALAIGVVINVIVGAVPTVRADLTAGQDFTLAQQTINILRGLGGSNERVQAIAFFTPQDNQQTAQDLLKEYKSYTSNFTYQFVDPVAQPAMAAQYALTRSGVVIFSNGKRKETATTVSERDFTSAILRLEQTAPKTVVFLTGQGERDPNDSAQAGYSQASQSLQANNYQVTVKSLLTSTITVSDTNVLVIAEPVRPLSSKELQAVQSYLDSGGHVLVLLDPAMPVAALQPLSDTLKKYGVAPQPGGIVDLQKTFSSQDPTVIGADTYPTSDITTDLSANRLPTLFALSMGVSTAVTPTTKYTASAIVSSSGGPPTSWLETDIRPGNTGSIQLQYDAGKDVPGPINVAVQVEPQALTSSTPVTATNVPKTRLVVFGDADFASNAILSQISQQGLSIYNIDLFGNTISWLAGANELVSIRPKDPTTPRGLTIDTGQKNVIFVASVIGLPVLVLLLGGINWWRRR
ncbi:MAG: GldG family protein [Chloroflexi bacterium]|nr:GldG family protein [Chloroflexota bacterium]